jgi:PelA/Pel-15E family pectate lyase
LSTWLTVAVLASALCAGCDRRSEGRLGDSWTVDDEPFRTSARHWYGDEEEEKIIRPLPAQPRYDLSEGAAIADNVLLFQRANGGWLKNYDVRAVLTGEQRRALVASRSDASTTFDNGATYSHVSFLAEAHLRTGEPRYRDACLRGIDFMLLAQNRNGGWPQFYPDTGGYRRYITFNDGAMIGVMTVLFRIAQEDPVFTCVDGERRVRVREALAHGVRCIVRCQVVQDGRPTVWCQQHDDLDYRPRGARTYEPAALASMESAEIVNFLMGFERPDGDVASAIRHAVKWFEMSAIRGIRLDKVSAPTTKYQHHTSTEDLVVVVDPGAPPLWARYYDLATNTPLFCNRDGSIVPSLAEVDRERRTGYSWYTGEPQAVIARYPAWTTREAARRLKD